MTLQDSEVDIDADSTAPARLGRKRDHTRDPEILDAALEVLAETGYDGMTVDMVAARAKAGKATVYRRWPSKADLVVDAVACMKEAELEHLPDTGTLRGDLVALIKPRAVQDSEQRLKVLAGILSMLSGNPQLSDALNAALIEPRTRANRIFLERAIVRGEIPADTDIETIAQIAPSMVAYRTLVQGKPFDCEYLVSLIDGVVLPAAGVRPPARGRPWRRNRNTSA